MKNILSGILICLFCTSSFGGELALQAPKLEIHSRKIGMLAGIQQGKYTSLDVGIEFQWRKLKLKDPWTIATNGTMEYNIQNNLLAYKIGGWGKIGRANLTFGGHVGMFTDFDINTLVVGPAVGFKALGFHFHTGANFQIAKTPIESVNTFYVGARYFFVNVRKMKMDRDKKGGKGIGKRKKN